jgi:hypothetical protein
MCGPGRKIIAGEVFRVCELRPPPPNSVLSKAKLRSVGVSIPSWKDALPRYLEEGSRKNPQSATPVSVSCRGAHSDSAGPGREAVALGNGVQQPTASPVLRENFFPVKRFSMVLSVSEHRCIAVTSIKVTIVLEKLSRAHVL